MISLPSYHLLWPSVTYDGGPEHWLNLNWAAPCCFFIYIYTLPFTRNPSLPYGCRERGGKYFLFLPLSLCCIFVPAIWSFSTDLKMPKKTTVAQHTSMTSLDPSWWNCNCFTCNISCSTTSFGISLLGPICREPFHKFMKNRLKSEKERGRNNIHEVFGVDSFCPDWWIQPQNGFRFMKIFNASFLFIFCLDGSIIICLTN